MFESTTSKAFEQSTAGAGLLAGCDRMQHGVLMPRDPVGRCGLGLLGDGFGKGLGAVRSLRTRRTSSPVVMPCDVRPLSPCLSPDPDKPGLPRKAPDGACGDRLPVVRLAWGTECPQGGCAPFPAHIAPQPSDGYFSDTPKTYPHLVTCVVIGKT